MGSEMCIRDSWRPFTLPLLDHCQTAHSFHPHKPSGSHRPPSCATLTRFNAMARPGQQSALGAICWPCLFCSGRCAPLGVNVLSANVLLMHLATLTLSSRCGGTHARSPNTYPSGVSPPSPILKPHFPRKPARSRMQKTCSMQQSTGEHAQGTVRTRKPTTMPPQRGLAGSATGYPSW